ncbi:hypothetical protein T06_15600, partial [Trichinella sp. T6]
MFICSFVFVQRVEYLYLYLFNVLKENDASLLLAEGENLKRLQSNLESYEEDPELSSMIQTNQRLRYRIDLLKT